MIPERWETKEQNPIIIPAYLLEKALRLYLRKDTGRTQICPWCEQIELGVWRWQEAIIHVDGISNMREVKGNEGERQKEREHENMRENAHTLEVWKWTPVIFSCLWYGREETTWERWRNHPKRLQGTMHQNYMVKGIVPFLSVKVKNFIIHRDIG